MLQYSTHGVHSETFKILDKVSCKKELNLQDQFVYGTINRNIWRKNYPTLLYAFSIVKAKYPDSTLLIVAGPEDMGGSSLGRYCKLFGSSMSHDSYFGADVLIHPAYGSVIQNLTSEQLVKANNAMDCFVSGSMGEGFGLPHIEALSCGIPLILPNNSCNSELAKGRGWLYESAKYANGRPGINPFDICGNTILLRSS